MQQFLSAKTYRKKLPRIEVIKWIVDKDGVFKNNDNKWEKDNLPFIEDFLGDTPVARNGDYLEIGNLLVKPGNLIQKDEYGHLSIIDEDVLNRDYDELYFGSYSDADYDMVTAAVDVREQNELDAESAAWAGF